MFMLVDVGVDAATEKVVVSASSDILVSIVCCLVGCVAWCVGQWFWGARVVRVFSAKKEKIRKIIFIWRIGEALEYSLEYSSSFLSQFWVMEHIP